MINKTITSKILSIGPSFDGKGGIAILIASISAMYETFNFIVSMKGHSKIKKLFVLFLAEFKLVYYCLFKGIRIVHIHSGTGIDFRRNSIFVYTAKLFGKMVILHIHGADFENFTNKNLLFVTSVCRKTDMLVTVSTSFVELLRSYQLNDQIRLLHNITSPPIIVPKNHFDNRVRLLFIGRIEKIKGIFDVLECIAEHKSYFEGRVVFDIGGVGDTEPMFSIIRANGLESIVNFHGWVDAEKKQQCFSQADVFVHPSYIESFGIAILEAMSYGLPVVTTAIGGIPDLVSNMENGLTVEPGNKEQIFEALKRMIEDVHLRKEFSLSSQLKAANFYPDIIEQKLRDIYVELL